MAIYLIQSKESLSLEKDVPIINSFKFGDKSYPDGAGIFEIEKSIIEQDKYLYFLLISPTEKELLRAEILSKYLKEIKKEYGLIIKHLPHSQEDKHFEDLDLVRIETFRYINKLDLFLNSNQTIYFDNHSSLNKYGGVDFIDKIYDALYSNILLNFEKILLIQPDKGAVTRINHLKKLIDNQINDGVLLKKDVKILKFDKTRDQKTGKIIDHYIENPELLEGEYDVCMVVDDLSIYGGTFVNIGKKIHKINNNLKLDLFISHALFYGGYENINKYYTNVYTVDIDNMLNINIKVVN